MKFPCIQFLCILSKQIKGLKLYYKADSLLFWDIHTQPGMVRVALTHDMFHKSFLHSLDWIKISLRAKTKGTYINDIELIEIRFIRVGAVSTIIDLVGCYEDLDTLLSAPTLSLAF